MENFQNQFNIESLLEALGGFVIHYGLRIVVAIIILIVGFWIIRRISNILNNLMEKRGFEPSLRGVLRVLTSVILKILVMISILSMIGVPMTAFIAILGFAGLAIGLALSGTLQNFAGGVLILMIKPFKTDDFIEAQNFMGTVKDIQIFNTILHTIDNVEVILPNGNLATGNITNYSTNEARRSQWVFRIPYGESYDKAKAVLKNLLENDPRVLKDPEPMIFLSELNDSSVDISVRAWAKSVDFWPLSFEIREKVYKAFADEGISIPFPQLDVHLPEQQSQVAD